MKQSTDHYTPPAFYRKADGSYVKPSLTRSAIEKLAAAMPLFGDDPDDRTYQFCTRILHRVFGTAWIKEHMADQKLGGFLTELNLSKIGAATAVQRVRDIAELVVNFLPHEGSAAPLGQLAGGNLESGYAELQVGRLLLNCGAPFRFVIPTGVKGEDYDFEVQFSNGLVACGDTKTKLETKDFSEAGIMKALRRAREQLPRDKPGVIFIKIPQKWHVNADLMRKIGDICQQFFASTQRIVCVEVFSVFLDVSENVVVDRMIGTEFRNPKSRFGDSESWRLMPTAPDGIPNAPGWISLGQLFPPHTNGTS